MSLPNALSFKLSPEWMYALIGGLASLPFAITSYSVVDNEISLSPVIAGLIAGYLAQRRLGKRDIVGLRAGLVAALPSIYILSNALIATSELTGPNWFVVSGTTVAVGFFALVAILVFGLSAVVGKLGAWCGGWLAERSSTSRNSTGGV